MTGSDFTAKKKKKKKFHGLCMYSTYVRSTTTHSVLQQQNPIGEISGSFNHKVKNRDVYLRLLVVFIRNNSRALQLCRSHLMMLMAVMTGQGKTPSFLRTKIRRAVPGKHITMVRPT